MGLCAKTQSFTTGVRRVKDMKTTCEKCLSMKPIVDAAIEYRNAIDNRNELRCRDKLYEAVRRYLIERGKENS